MKTKILLLIAMLSPLALFAQTNDIANVSASNPVQPILDLLGGKGTWLTTIITWVAAISAALSPFAVWIRNKLADSLNRAAETQDDETDDEYLRKLFSNPVYKFAAFVLNFANVRLPTLAELERAVKLQKEAVGASKAMPVVGGYPPDSD